MNMFVIGLDDFQNTKLLKIEDLVFGLFISGNSKYPPSMVTVAINKHFSHHSHYH